MIGTKLEDGSFSGTIPSMMKKVGLKLQMMVTSNSNDKESMDKLSEKVLGYLWDPVSGRM